MSKFLLNLNIYRKSARFIKYNDFVVQGIKNEPHNICYRLKCYEIPGGDYVMRFCGKNMKNFVG